MNLNKLILTAAEYFFLAATFFYFLVMKDNIVGGIYGILTLQIVILRNLNN